MKFGMENIKKKAVCPCCGKGWIEDDRYCRYCGAKKDNPKYIYPDFACIYGPAPVKRTHRCESCGYKWTTRLMIDNEDFCPKCGGSAPLKAQKGKRFFRNGPRNLNNNIVEEPDDDETMWLCPICETSNRFKSKYCKNCGHPR